MLVSVVIPTFNRSAVIIRAINSVFNQTFKDYELIIVDDGSSDDTYESLKLFIDTKKIKYFRQNNLGVSAARNLGVKNANGQFVAFLDSDDEWLPHKLNEQIKYLSNNPDIKIVYSDEIWIRNGKRVNQKAIHKKSGGNIFPQCVEQCFIAPSSTLISKDFFVSIGGFDENFLVCEDYDLWLKISSIHEIGFISEPLIVKHGGHIDQLSTKYFAMDFWRIKSMLNILKVRKLDPLNRAIVINSINRRAEILKLGYKKHNKEQEHDTLVKILKGEFI